MIHTAEYDSPIGPITLASDGTHLVGLWLRGQKYYGDGVPGEWTAEENLPVLAAGKEWLRRYFAGEKPLPGELPLAPAGSEFRQTVYKLLCEIPYGETVSYGQLAKQVAARLGLASMSAQAVGGAVGHNPISIIIPCHRIVGVSGSLTGYAGGIQTKRWLLKHEGVPVERFTLPRRGSAL